jgi:hypothetical protein
MNLDLAIFDLYTRWENRRFQWGDVDCCQFALDAAKTIHGYSVDYIIYNDQDGAIETLADLGGYRGILSAFCRKIEPRQIRRGDFVLVPGKAPFDEALAVVIGKHAYTTGRKGLVPFERSTWVECWTPGVCNA